MSKINSHSLLLGKNCSSNGGVVAQPEPRTFLVRDVCCVRSIHLVLLGGPLWPLSQSFFFSSLFNCCPHHHLDVEFHIAPCPSSTETSLAYQELRLNCFPLLTSLEIIIYRNTRTCLDGRTLSVLPLVSAIMHTSKPIIIATKKLLMQL